MPKIKVKGQTVQTGERIQTNGRTHTHTHTHTHTDATKRIISPAIRSIMKQTKSNRNSTYASDITAIFQFLQKRTYRPVNYFLTTLTLT